MFITYRVFYSPVKSNWIQEEVFITLNDYRRVWFLGSVPASIHSFVSQSNFLNNVNNVLRCSYIQSEFTILMLGSPLYNKNRESQNSQLGPISTKLLLCMLPAIYERVKLVSLKPDHFIWYNKIKLYFVESNLLLEYFL